MQKAILFFCIVLLASCSSSTSNTADQPATTNAAAAIKKGTVKNIGVEEFDRMDGKYGIFVIDVRTPSEINEGKIRGAIDLDISDPEFNEHIARMDRKKSYILYCKSGGRSSRASEMMAGMGFQNVYNLEGGYTAWKEKHPNE